MSRLKIYELSFCEVVSDNKLQGGSSSSNDLLKWFTKQYGLERKLLEAPTQEDPWTVETYTSPNNEHVAIKAQNVNGNTTVLSGAGHINDGLGVYAFSKSTTNGL
ncbi:MAG: hypothetical protein QNJ55_29305 [Xenococcus sp. MO_188.B8]|nr:hypothetical protein [Xenococcus sp. MO_188.B8]